MIRILVSNTPIPSSKIGSWTNRISRLIEKDENFFSFILSPARIDNPKNIFCKKKKFIPLFPSKFRQWQLLNYRANSFVKVYKSLAKHQVDKIQIVVMDDVALLEAFAMLKSQGEKFDLIFSFHGHSLYLPSSWSIFVNRILFLTESGYHDTLQMHDEFTPIVSIVGNGVDSSVFFPISKEDKQKRKNEFGIPKDAKVLIWLSNNRPKKGFHLFRQVAKKIIDRYPDLYIWVIGVDDHIELSHDRIKFFGKVPNPQLPFYLQASDFYMFTSLCKEGFGLTLVEAAKCGNQVLASKLGGIPDVAFGIEGVFLINNPNIPEEWESAFSLVWKNADDFSPNHTFLNNLHSLENWMTNFKKALVY